MCSISLLSLVGGMPLLGPWDGMAMKMSQLHADALRDGMPPFHSLSLSRAITERQIHGPAPLSSQPTVLIQLQVCSSFHQTEEQGSI